MGLTCMDVVTVFRGCPVDYIQARLKDAGYLVRLSVVAEMLSIAYLEIELEGEKKVEGLADEQSKEVFLPYNGGCVGGKRPRVDRGLLPA